MIYRTQDLLTIGETKYSISKKVRNKKLYRLERGLFSDTLKFNLEEQLISTKYPFCVLTGVSAFSFYDLTDIIPDKVYVATLEHSFPIRKENVVQSYQSKEYFNIGITSVEYDGGAIRIYDLERTLIELIRRKSKYSPELYYEVLNSFRKNKHKLDYVKINEYASKFKNYKSIINTIREVI